MEIIMKQINQNKLLNIEELKAPIRKKFGWSPFSIFDTTNGDWMNRCREWKNLGIKSELGRGDNLTFNIGINQSSNYGKCLPALGEKYGRKHDQQTSVFNPVICELIYSWFMPKNGDKILDCFAGGSVRGIVASILGKEYTGIDIRKEQIQSNYEQFENINKKVNLKKINWICEDSKNIDKILKDEKYDLLFSCPPYYDLEKYSDNKDDLSNLSNYEEFLSQYEDIINKSCKLLKENRFAVFVVGDIRDKFGFYRNFIGDTIEIFEKCGLLYYNKIIIINSCGSLPVIIGKQFNKTRKIGKRHQDILIFYKGNPKKIYEEFGDIIIDE
jgi:16S rRNA G966 N2-methylase RsmD